MNRKLKQIIALLTPSFLLLFLNAKAQAGKEDLALIRKFQEGYTNRDTSAVSKFVNDICSGDIQIIGTSDGEIIHGINAARNLFVNDWLYWFSVKIDTSTIRLNNYKGVDFFFLHATASITFPTKEAAYDFAYQRLNQAISLLKTTKDKLLAYSSEASNLIQQIESGSLDVRFSLRISGAIVSENNKRLFNQIIFSFPYPMVRK